MPTTIEVRRLGPQIGAEVRGVDVKALDDAGFAEIYRAWLAHNVLVVPEQQLEIEDFLRYSRPSEWSSRIPPSPRGIRSIPRSLSSA